MFDRSSRFTAVVVPWTAVAIALAACGDDGGDSATGSDRDARASQPDGGMADAAAPDGSRGHVERTVGPQGGELGADGALLRIPEGALEDEVQIRIRVVPEPVELPGDWEASGEFYEITPHGLSFAVPITIELPYEGRADESVNLVKLDDDNDESWAETEAESFDGGKVRFLTSSLSFYTVVRSCPLELDSLEPGAVITGCEDRECGPHPQFAVCGSCGACARGETCGVDGMCRAGTAAAGTEGGSDLVGDAGASGAEAGSAAVADGASAPESAECMLAGVYTGAHPQSGDALSEAFYRGGVLVRRSGARVFYEAFESDGGRLFITDGSLEPGGCPDVQGEYELRFGRDCTSVSLTAVSDACECRRAALDGVTLDCGQGPCEDHLAVEAQPFLGYWRSGVTDHSADCGSGPMPSTDSGFVMQIRPGATADLEAVVVDQEDLTTPACVFGYDVTGDTATLLEPTPCSAFGQGWVAQSSAFTVSGDGLELSVSTSWVDANGCSGTSNGPYLRLAPDDLPGTAVCTP